MSFYDLGKRLIDILGGIVGLIIFAPFMALIAFWIKLVSPEGPVFADIPYRVGKDGNLFRMYKFRSMIPNAQNWLNEHPEWLEKYKANSYKLDPDPRLIKGAKFIRKSSVDELPQFLNVLLGNMSLVGPRAYMDFELQQQLEKFPDAKANVDLLIRVKPGITGPWQVGGRSEISFVERVKIDADYAQRRSLLYDIMILLKTPFAVLSQKGSY